MPVTLTGMYRMAVLAFMTIALALCCGLLWPTPLRAQDLTYPQARQPIVAVDWQGPMSLPPRFRNHCHYDVNHGAWSCSDHCGIDYQFYFCSPASFGCCRTNYGYCDWKEQLRCAP
jgi:hypothetical protein